MPKQPEDLVVRILRDIQQTLASHSRRFDQMDQTLDELRRGLDEVNGGVITSLGLATQAHVRQKDIQKEIDDLKKRVKRLETKR
jgi:uncharacterized coiled-coil DUF342 family protein